MACEYMGKAGLNKYYCHSVLILKFTVYGTILILLHGSTDIMECSSL